MAERSQIPGKPSGPSSLTETVGYEEPKRTALAATIGYEVPPKSPQRAGLAATVGYEDPPKSPAKPAAPSGPLSAAAKAASVAATVAQDAPPARGIGHDATVATDASTLTMSVSPKTTTTVRTTVLPRIRMADGAVTLENMETTRYEELKPLGEGGVGEVVLVHDHDIERRVALKRLRSDAISDASLVRFAEEIRTIGRLEHPNIVPVHDVGIDSKGHHYFVMKFVEGETLENILEKLAANDPKYVDKYTPELRKQIFLGVLQAIHYAHAHGIVHRDIKPANVMVGPFGEVMVMDWGLAKQIRKDAAKSSALEVAMGAKDGEPHQGGTERERIFKTRHGSLLGTPAYMSPEQARGLNDQIDERSDIYSLCVMFHEMLTRRHYLLHCQTVPAVISEIIAGQDYSGMSVVRDGETTGAAAEYLHFVRKGLAKDPAARYASVEEMINRLEQISDGYIQVQCPCTLIKHTGNSYFHFLNRYPLAGMAVFYGGLTLLLVMLVTQVLFLARIL